MNFKLLIKTFILASVLFLTACATGPKFEKLDTVPEKQAEVYFLRPAKFVGSAKPYEILVDDQRKATLRNGGYSKIQLEPGKHKVVVQPEILQTLSLSKDTATEYIVTEPGKRYFLTFSINNDTVGNTFYVAPNTLVKLDEASAVEVLKDLRQSE